MKSSKQVQFMDFVKPKAPTYIASIFLAAASVFFGLLSYYIVYRLLMNISKGSSVKMVFIYALMILSCFSLQILMHSLSTAISHKTAFAILEKVRLSITKKTMQMPLGYTQTKGNGYFHNLLIDSIERLEYPLAHAIPETTSNVLLPLGIIGLLFIADWRMGLAIAIPAIITLLFYLPMYSSIMNEFANTYYKALEDMNGRVIEYIRGNKEIKIFGREHSASSKYEESIDNYKNATLRLYNKMYFAVSPAMVILSSLLISILCVGGFLYCRKEITAHLYLFSILVSVGIENSLLKFTEFMDNFYHIKNGMHLVNEVLAAPELCETNNKINKIIKDEISMQNVTFRYDNDEVLKDISVVFAEKTKTAIVGPSGSGKSTIANLISRFWDIDKGKITIGGIEYKNLSLEQLMLHVNYVTQDTFLFNMSIMENIRLGKPNAKDDDVIDAAMKAQCHKFILNLEKGYHTCAGDDGAKLSGGQRQRIIIARAILKNAPILILDEATAYTDMENQQKIQHSLQELCKDKTLIIIAHRLSTIIDCDQIVVINGGKIDAIGTHNELLKISNLYLKMWKTHKNSQNWKLQRSEVTPC